MVNLMPIEIHLCDRVIELYGKEQGGVYKVRAFRDQILTNPIPIPRLLKADPSGLLYTGRATMLWLRLASITRCLLPQYTDADHPFGVRTTNWRKSCQPLSNDFRERI